MIYKIQFELYIKDDYIMNEEEVKLLLDDSLEHPAIIVSNVKLLSVEE